MNADECRAALELGKNSVDTAKPTAQIFILQVKWESGIPVLLLP
jgi:hypothetical protein